jgi:hypothetical protein
MRRVVFATSFVDDADTIASYIESIFGISRADAFVDDLDRFCALVALTIPALDAPAMATRRRSLAWSMT